MLPPSRSLAADLGVARNTVAESYAELVAEGWRVRQVKIWKTCYEVYGFDEKGERAEAFFNPKTFERVPER